MRRKKEGEFDRIDEKQELIPPKIVRRQLPSHFSACQHSDQLQPSQRDILHEKQSTTRVISQHSSSPELIIPLFCSLTHRPSIMTAFMMVWERKKEKKKSVDIIMATACMVYYTKLLDEQVVSLALFIMTTMMMTTLTPFPSLLQAVVAAFFEPTLLSVLTILSSTSSRIDDTEKKAVV